MNTSKVYFTDFRTGYFGESMPAKLKRLAREAGIGDIDMNGKFVAIKMHLNMALSINQSKNLLMRILM